MNINTKIARYIVLAVITIILGLLSRSDILALPKFLKLYAGDALWALLVFWLFCIVKPTWKTQNLALGAIIFSYAIEISQLYHAPWIDQVRSNRIGGLVLGFGFKWSDLVLYTLGIALGVIINKVFFFDRKTHHE